MSKKYVYDFSEGKKDLKKLLGGKGANLAEMSNLKIPVPDGFTISTEVCQIYQESAGKYPKTILDEIDQHLDFLEKKTKKRFGSKKNPLLVSVRSGAAVSMPGMMDTILNLGLNDETVISLAKETKNEKFSYDAYRRLIQMFGNVVLKLDSSKFEEELAKLKKKKGVENDFDLEASDLKSLIESYKKIIKKNSTLDFPQDPKKQLRMAIDAVFDSWNNERAIYYRKMNNLDFVKGTAVNVQEMVFGNKGNSSATGVCFSRNPSTGKKEFYGEYLINAQGEDVVAGVRTPKHINELKKEMPEIYDQLVKIKDKLEDHYRDMQDMEFTIEEGKLFLLQTRNGKRTAHAAVKISMDLLREHKISEKEALLRVTPEQISTLLHKQIDPLAKKNGKLLGRGLPASPGAAVGKIVFDPLDAKKFSEAGEKVVLARKETSPEDLIGMHVSEGIVTSRGGMTSHAAVVARGMGKCCISGLKDLKIDFAGKKAKIGTKELKEGDIITLDGSTGEFFLGELELSEVNFSKDFKELMTIADRLRRMEVRTNADTPEDAKKALEFGAEGIGLCRTEHMFFQGDRIKLVREMILSSSKEARVESLNKLMPIQKEDFRKLFVIMDSKPVTIRLLDPPLHEFLPKTNEELNEIAKDLNISISKIKAVREDLLEVNPMMGHRGCRLGIYYPEITRMQVRAIFEAAYLASEQIEKEIIPEIMVPLVGDILEFENQKQIIEDEIRKIFSEKGFEIPYKIGTMIEVPRAALNAQEIAKKADFFSFGTNDLTQMTFGFSRDDSSKFIADYLKKGILKNDPFKVLDEDGVGKLVKLASESARVINPKFKLGICGEHGGNKESIEFCESMGLDYVSCSPYRVPVARFSSAIAAIKQIKR